MKDWRSCTRVCDRFGGWGERHRTHHIATFVEAGTNAKYCINRKGSKSGKQHIRASRFVRGFKLETLTRDRHRDGAKRDVYPSLQQTGNALAGSIRE
jgi:hypothetical protein